MVQFEKDGSKESSDRNLDDDSEDSADKTPSGSNCLNCIYIQMELCNSTLRHLISTGELFVENDPLGVMNPDQMADCQKRAWKLFRQLCDGLAYIHKQVFWNLFILTPIT